MNTVQKTLTSARDLLLKYGWIQHDDGSRSKGFCAGGAIDASTKNYGRMNDASEALKDAFPRRRSIVAFNDQRGRTKRQVIAMFNKAIKLAGKKV